MIRSLGLVCFLTAMVGQADAQVLARPELRGTVMVGSAPLSEGTVILHRVSTDASGNIDSTRVADDGTFAFVLPSVPDPGGHNDIYFASSRYDGVLYFGPAISLAAELDSTYVIQAYRSVVVPPEGAALTVAVRNLFLEPGPENTWQATDVLQLRNDGEATLIAAGEGAVWSYALPPVASGFTLGQGDLPPDAVEFVGHLIRLKAPVPPGERFLMVGYSLPVAPFDVPIGGLTESMEVLVREPAPALDVIGLDEIDVVSLEAGSNFRRYGRVNLVDATISIRAGEAERGIPMRELAVFLSLLLGGVGIYAFRRPHATPTPAPLVVQPDPRAALLLEIAKLDQQMEAVDLSEAERAEHTSRRAALLKDLTGTG